MLLDGCHIVAVEVDHPRQLEFLRPGAARILVIDVKPFREPSSTRVSDRISAVDGGS